MLVSYYLPGKPTYQTYQSGNGWISQQWRCCSLQGSLVTSSSGSLTSSSRLAALLLVGGTTVALPANRGGRRRESKAWMTKAHVEGHVDTTSIGGEVEGGIPASSPNIQELCQGSLDEVEVVHLKRVKELS